MRGHLFVNPRSGDASPSVEELRAEAERRGIAVHVLAAGDEVEELAREADAEALGVAGGDGSLGKVAGVAIERGLPFVCVPFGTRNHFARDAGLDRSDPIAALAAFDGQERMIDVGRVDGHVFLNNLSVGIYGTLVHRRERHRRRRQTLAAGRALWLALGTHQRLRVEVNGRPLHSRILLLANNSYDLSLFSLGARDRLDGGLLHLYSADGVLPRTWQEETSERFELRFDRRAPAALDGESLVLGDEAVVTIERGALRLLGPG